MRTKVKRAYESPLMECTQIEAEGTFAGSVITKEKSEVQTESQQYHEIDSQGTWDNGQDTGMPNVTWE